MTGPGRISPTAAANIARDQDVTRKQNQKNENQKKESKAEKRAQQSEINKISPHFHSLFYRITQLFYFII